MSKIFVVAVLALLLVLVTTPTVLAARASPNNININSNTTTRVAAVQIFPVTGGTAQQNIANTVTSVVQTVQSNSPGIDFFNTPEFLFNGGLEYAAAGVCSGDATNSSGTLRDYCFAVPEAGQSFNCNSQAAPATAVACALVTVPTTVSINVCELASDGKLYNTQVIIKQGFVVAKYHKFHPFFTACFTKPSLELVTFNVNNLKFGVFTCFDILFQDPKMDLVKMGIKYFSYSVALPDIATDAVAIFSWENSVTVVASDADGAQSAVVVNGKAMKQCTTKTGTCLAIYDL